MSTRGRETSATLVGVLAIVLWAALALTTVQARGIPPFEILTLSFGVAFLAGLAVLAARGRAALAELRQPLAPWMTAFAGIFFYHALYFFALSAAPAAQASLIAYLWPLFIVVFSALLPGEHLRARHLVGAVLGLAGTALVLESRGGDASVVASRAGYAAAFGCALIWSGYSVLNRRFETTPSGMIIGVCGAVALAGAVCHRLAETTVAPDARQWIALVILGLGPTGLAFLAWDHATKHGRLPLLGALSYLAPLISTLLLVLDGQARADLSLFVAATLVIAGALWRPGFRPAKPTAGGLAPGRGRRTWRKTFKTAELLLPTARRAFDSTPINRIIAANVGRRSRIIQMGADAKNHNVPFEAPAGRTLVITTPLLARFRHRRVRCSPDIWEASPSLSELCSGSPMPPLTWRGRHRRLKGVAGLW